MITKFKKNIVVLLLATMGCITYAAKPIKVLMVNGGCFHDYATQTRILVDSLNKYIYNIDWQILSGNGSCEGIVPLMASKDWGKGYDLIIYNVCWAYVYDTAYVNNICRVHSSNGTNAIVVHCTMHTFRDAKTDQWRELLGVESHEHAASGKFVVTNVNPKHPVMKDFPPTWPTPVDEELYKIVKEYPNTVPLATGKGEDGKDYTCLWANTYGKAKVIGITIGHATETLQDHSYLLFLARSVLWLNGKTDANGEPLPEYWKQSFVPDISKALKHEPLVIENFESYASNDSLKKVWNRPWGNDLIPSLESVTKGSGKKGLKCLFKTETEPVKNCAVLSFTKKVDLSQYNSLQFWYKPDVLGRRLSIQLNPANDFGENVGDLFEANYDTHKSDTSARIVTIPFSAFKRSANADLSLTSFNLNKANILQITFIVRSNEAQAGNGVYYLDDVKAITEIKLPVVLENFDRYYTNGQLAKRWLIPGHGAQMHASLEPNVKGNGKYSLKCEFNNEKSKDNFYSAICSYNNWDFTGANAFQYWFKPDGTGHETTIEFSISDKNGKNIHDLWKYTYAPKKGDTTARYIVVPFDKLVHNTQYKDADVSPVFKPESVIETVIYIGGINDEPGKGVYYFDEFKAVKLPAIVDNFDNNLSDGKTALGWYTPGHGALIKHSLDPKVKGGGKFSLKCEYTVTKSNDKFYAPICRVDKWDLSGSNALQFWFKPDGSGREFTIELNTSNSKGLNIHDLWDFKTSLQKGDTAGRIITIPFSKFVHNTKFQDAPDVSPEFKPQSVNEIAIYISGPNDEPGSGAYYFDEIQGVHNDELEK